MRKVNDVTDACNAGVCGNAVAKYDKETKTAYLEYQDGTREDVL